MCCVRAGKEFTFGFSFFIMLENYGGVAVFGCLFITLILHSDFCGTLHISVSWSGIYGGAHLA